MASQSLNDEFPDARETRPQREPSYFTGIRCKVQRFGTVSLTEFRDPVCGNYHLPDSVRECLDERPSDKHLIAFVLATRVRRKLGQGLAITRDNKGLGFNYQGAIVAFEELLSEAPASVAETLDECLVNLAEGAKHPSDEIQLMEDSNWWLYSPTDAQAYYFLDALREQGLVSFTDRGAKLLKLVRLTILPAGWSRLAELRKRPPGGRKQAFVAMWFDPSMEPFFADGIRPAVEADGTRCMRIDLKEHNNKICDEIIAEIRRSKYLVADFTGQRGGVYYEAGFAFGLGLPVISTVRADDLERLHFDTRQYSHITYATPDELRTKLLNRIRATIT